MKKIFKNHFKYILVILTLWLTYFYKIIFLGEIFYVGDNQSINIPFINFFLNSLSQGEFPLWNPYILSGTPFTLPSNILLFPTLPLFLAISPENAMTITMIVITLVAGLSMYLFSCIYTHDKKAALLSAVIYMFSGFLAKNHASYVTSLSFAYVPLLLFFYYRFPLLAGVVLALNIISGHPMLVYITLLFLLVISLFQKRIIPFLIILVVGFGLSAPIVLFGMEASQYSTRPTTFEYATTASLEPKFLLTAFLPHLYGIPEIELKNNPGNFMYVGILPLLLVFFLLQKKNRVFLIPLLISIVLMLGKFTFLYHIAFLIPGLSLFRQPSYFVLVYIFLVSLTAPLGIPYLKKIKHPILFIIYFICVLALVILLSTGFSARLEKIRLISIEALKNIVFTLIILFVSGKLLKKHLYTGILLLAFLDLFFLNQSEFFTTKYEYLQSPQKLSFNLQDKIISIPKEINADWNSFNRDNLLLSRTREAENSLSPNRNMIYGVNSALGFSPLVSKNYISYLSNKTENIVGLTNADVDLNNPNLSKAGVNYIVSSSGIVKLPARKRAFLIDKSGDETGAAIITKTTANTVQIIAQTQTPSQLILLDTYFPGWEAEVDGVKTEVERFEETFRQIDLNPGTHVVNFIFKPQSFYTGLKITFITLVIISLYCIYKLLRKRGSQSRFSG